MGLRNWKGPKQENSNPGAPNGTFVSRKQQRKTAKRIKKLQNIAYAKKQKIEDVMEEAFNKGNDKKKKNAKGKPKVEPVKIAPKLKLEDDSSGDEAKFAYEVDPKVAKKMKRKRGALRDSESGSDSDDCISYKTFLKEVAQKKEETTADGNAVDTDDADIARYAKLLKLKKPQRLAGNLPKKFEEDGLDFILDFCDPEKRKEIVSMEEKEIDLHGDDLDSDGSLSEEYDDGGVDLSEGEESVGDEKGLDGESDFEDEDEEMGSGSEDEGSETEKTPEVVEDIYGRTIDKRSGELIKFDPAGARKRLAELDSRSGDNEARLHIDKTITGLINRLSEATVVKSKQTITELWHNNSKNDVKNSLSKVVWRLLDAPYRLQDSLLSSYAMFLGLINGCLGSEISAHFVEVFLVDYVKQIKEAKEQDNKARENRTVLIAHLLNFRVTKPSIIIDVLKKLRESFTLDNLQLIYTMCIYSWKQMRRQCWLDFVEQITETDIQLQASDFANQPRAKFLGEELSALKKEAAAGVDLSIVEQHQKMFFGLLKAEKDVERELGMGLDDLLQADERGRWWVVGSAFRLSGDVTDGPATDGGAAIGGAGNRSVRQFSSDLVELARKAKMNTQVRRDIFCTIASAANEDEAFEQLLKLSLKGQQERDLVYVIVQMMLKEKQYNPYYATLVSRFCEFDRKFKMTTQFAIWDRIREAGALKPKGRLHLASFIHHIISHEVLPITVLKVVEWGMLTSAVSSVLRKVFSLLGSSPQNRLRKIFEPILKPDKNPNLTEGLRVFLEVNFGDHEGYRQADTWFFGL